ncbi:MAG: stage II sporulation protein M [Candidatus Woesearchaeota archaeon]
MVVESLINPKNVLKEPHRVFFYSFIVSVLAVILSYYLFHDFASIASLAFIVIGLLPFVNKILKVEEGVDVTLSSEKEMMKEHRKAIKVFLYIFLAISLAYLLFYLILPTEAINVLFNYQIETITNINSVSGSSNMAGNMVSSHPFFIILLNNLRVLIFCIIFSFIYSSGAIFVMAWNASLISVAIGSFIRNGISQLLNSFGSLSGFNYVHIFSVGILRYFLHGVFEVVAYLFAALAGGIISYAVINHHYQSKRFYNVVFDSFDLIVLSIIFLIIGALIEIYISPLIGVSIFS